MTLDMDAYQLISLAIVIVGGCWAWNRWLITRMDNGDAAVRKELQANAENLHGRVSKARDDMVPRIEFDREMNRVHAEVSGVRDEVVRSGERQVSLISQQTGRIDQILLAVQKRKDDS